MKMIIIKTVLMINLHNKEFSCQDFEDEVGIELASEASAVAWEVVGVLGPLSLSVDFSLFRNASYSAKSEGFSSILVNFVLNIMHKRIAKAAKWRGKRCHGNQLKNKNGVGSISKIAVSNAYMQ